MMETATWHARLGCHRPAIASTGAVP
jgi:hypothetical protein